MKRITIQGKEILSEQQFHNILSQSLNFPEWYGGNLDALFDCLTDLSEQTEIAISQYAHISAALGGRAQLILDVLRDAASENPRLKISIEK